MKVSLICVLDAAVWVVGTDSGHLEMGCLYRVVYLSRYAKMETP